MKLEPVLGFSTGLYASMAATLNLVSVPAILSSSDPLPAWRTTYNRGKNIAFTCVGTTTATALTMYFDSDNKNPKLLIISGLTISVVAYTLLFMKSTNDALFAIESKPGDSKDGEVRKLIAKWNKLHWGRTLLTLGAFGVTLSLICKK